MLHFYSIVVIAKQYMCLYAKCIPDNSVHSCAFHTPRCVYDPIVWSKLRQKDTYGSDYERTQNTLDSIVLVLSYLHAGHKLA